jgi:hypothetical protein
VHYFKRVRISCVSLLKMVRPHSIFLFQVDGVPDVVTVGCCFACS